MTEPTSPLQNCRSRTGFRHSRSHSTAVAPGTIVSSYFLSDYFLHPQATAMEQERECRNPVRERHGSFVTGTSASLPGVPRHISYIYYVNSLRAHMIIEKVDS